MCSKSADYAGGSQWDASDKAALQRVLDPLCTSFRKQPMGFLSSEGSTLMCTPPGEVYDRLTGILSNVSIVSGIVLSAIAGVALSPLDLDEFDEKRNAADLYNAVAAVAVAVQLCVTLYSTFTLYILMASAHSPSAVYRALTHMTRWIGFLEFMTFVPALLCFMLIGLASHLYSSTMVTRVVAVTMCAFVLSFQIAFNHMCQHAFPYNAWAWTSVFGGIYWMLPRPFASTEAVARAHGELLVSQAKEGVLGGLDKDDDLVIDTDASVEPGEVELDTWLEAVLKLTQVRRKLLVHGLYAGGLTRARMIEAVQHGGGYHTLCEMLSSGELRMRPGERLALASAAMRAAALDQISALPST